jgi:peptidoglycan hydrolase CwlO-like protein
MQTKSVAYGDVVPVLVEAIKEQQQQIKNQKKEIDELKALLTKLKGNKIRRGNN